MNIIFHEKQEGALCAQHCLNSLLQGSYYTAVDLATFAKQLDDAEQERMAEGDVNSPDYVRFMEQPSTNMDDTGRFSIQVICKALEVWGLESVPYNNPQARSARENPTKQMAFICNLQQHWFTIRKLGNQWFNLNSLFAEPEIVSNTYLSLLLAQLQTEGYSIFVIIGKLPNCEADECIGLHPIDSQGQSSLYVSNIINESASSSQKQTDVPVDHKFIRDKRMQYLNNTKITEYTTNDKAEKQTTPLPSIHGNDLEDAEEEMLKAAIEMSLQNSV